MNLKNYNSVGFDAFGTLIQGGNKTDRYHFELIKKYVGDLRKSQLLTSSYSQIAEEYFRQTFKASGANYDNLSHAENSKLHDTYEEDSSGYKLFERTEELLEKVKHKAKNIFLISNISSLYIPVVEKLGLHNYFNFILYSCNVGIKKSMTNANIFDKAYTEINKNKTVKIPRNRILYTGDNKYNDEVAPKNAGFDSINIEKLGR